MSDAFNRSGIATLNFKLFPDLFGDLEGSPKHEAIRQTVSYATRQGKIPALVEYVKVENPYRYNLYLPRIERNLGNHYQGIRDINEIDRNATDIGPDIDWQGPSDEDLELQFGKKPDPEIQDVGFLIQAIERSGSVCRIEVPSINSQGTGFLIAPDLVLTNYHVIAPNKDDDLDKNARNAWLRFGDVRSKDTDPEARLKKYLAFDDPVLKSSPTHELDYALLKLEDRASKGIDPAPYSLAVPYKSMSIHILQHPNGAPLQLAQSGNGVDRVILERGLVQYSTRALSGSSGAPCFNDDWQVVALHHAQRARSLYSIREGIIFRSIYGEIRELLP